MSRIMTFMSEIRKDLNFKSSYLTRLKVSKPNLGELSLEQYWRDALSEIAQCLGGLNGQFEWDTESLLNTILQSAEFGLCFNPKHKHCYIEVKESLYMLKTLEFDLGFKYNGLKSRLVKGYGVKAITTEVVHTGDSFEWRGRWNEPFYVMSNSPSDVLCCFGVVELSDKRFVSYKLDLQELLALEEADVQRAIQIYGNKEASLYCSAYRKRMFEIATLRYIYREVVSLFEDEESTSLQSGTTTAEYDLAKAMEQELNKQLAVG